VQVLLLLAFGQDSCAHQELYAMEAHVAKSEVPFEPFLFRWSNILVCVVYHIDGVIQYFRDLIDGTVADGLRSGKVVSWVDLCDDGARSLFRILAAAQDEVFGTQSYRFVDVRF
jgi:hypothetical protein